MAGCGARRPPLAARHSGPAQSLSPSAENRGLKAKGGCHSGHSRLSREKKKKRGWWGEKSQSCVCWESQVAPLGGEVLASTGRRGEGAGQCESGEKSHILCPFSLPELRGPRFRTGPGSVRISARAKHPCCCPQRPCAGAQEKMSRALVACPCRRCQTSPGDWSCSHGHYLPVCPRGPSGPCSRCQAASTEVASFLTDGFHPQKQL